MRNKVSPENLIRLCTYIKQRREGDFISRRDHHEHYLGFPLKITQEELNLLAKLAADYLLLPNENIHNHMGEIIFSIKE